MSVQLGVPANILLQDSFTTASYSPAADQTALNVTVLDTASIRSTIQVRGTKALCLAAMTNGGDLMCVASQLWKNNYACLGLASSGRACLELLSRRACAILLLYVRRCFGLLLLTRFALLVAQLRGPSLVPFTFDKQVLLLETLFAIWRRAM